MKRWGTNDVMYSNSAIELGKLFGKSMGFILLLFIFVSFGQLAVNPPSYTEIPNKKVFGFWQSSWNDDWEQNFSWGSQEGMLDNAKAFRGILPNQFGDHTHPVDVFVVDIHWVGGNNYWSSNEWYTDSFPDPEAMFQGFTDMHLLIAQCTHHYWDDSQKEALTRDLGWGMDLFWLDYRGSWNDADSTYNFIQDYFGEDTRMTMLFHDTNTPEVYKSRSSVFWNGDINSVWTDLERGSIEWCLEKCESGLFWVSTDTPGHWGGSLEGYDEMATRWVQFADWSPISRNHGHDGRCPWNMGSGDPIGLNSTTHEGNSYFSRMLRYRLIPYIYTFAWHCWEYGTPMMRSFKLAFPGEADGNYHQYMFGDAFLVAPVYRGNLTEMDVFLPAGSSEKWINYWDHTEYQGGQTIQVPVQNDNWKYIPLFVKKGSIIPMGPEIQWIEPSEASDPLTLDIYPKTHAEGGTSTFTLYDDDGVSKKYKNGSYATTEITCTQNAVKDITIDVGAMTGDYTGKPTSRKFIIKVNLYESEPGHVNKDGAALKKQADYTTLLDTGSNVTSGWGYDSDNKIVYAKYESATNVAVKIKMGEEVSILTHHDGTPSPFNLQAYNGRIYFQVPGIDNKRSHQVGLKLYSLEGKLIQTLANGTFNSEKHSVGLDRRSTGSRLAAGLYFCQLTIGTKTKTITVLLK